MSEESKPPSVSAAFSLAPYPSVGWTTINRSYFGLHPQGFAVSSAFRATSAFQHHGINAVQCRFCASARALALHPHRDACVSRGGGTFHTGEGFTSGSRPSSLTPALDAAGYIKAFGEGPQIFHSLRAAFQTMARDRKDYFYRKAKEHGYRARSAYKLQQMNKKFRLIRKGDRVLDLGAAPGGWLQVAKDISTGPVVGVDLESIEPIEGVVTIRADITAEETLDQIRESLGGEADVVICDAAPNLTGNWTLDHARSIDLCRSALALAEKVLKPGGNFLVKVFQGDTFQDYYSEVKADFRRVQSTSPAASRKESAEMYIIGQGFIKAPVKAGKEIELEIVGIGKSGDGLGFVEGFKVFVPDTKKGEKVRVKIETVRPNFSIGRLVGG